MTESTRSGWLRFSSPPFDFDFSYPPTGTGGALITVREQERSDRQRVHVSTDDARDVYFELEHVERRTVEEGVAELAADLRGRFDDATFGGLEPASLEVEPGRSMRFTFVDKVRVAFFTVKVSRAHRVILVPLSPSNLEILASLACRG